MKGWRERDTIRLLHLVLSFPILGFIYGPVAEIPRAAFFTRWIAIPVVLLSGFWLWLKPKVMQRLRAKPRAPVLWQEGASAQGTK